MHTSLFEHAKATIFRGYDRDIQKVEDGIIAFWPARQVLQASEQRMRDMVVRESPPQSTRELLERVGMHHSLAVMAKRAERFRGQFRDDEWVLDIGGGTGWYWRGTRGGNIVLVDFSLEMLKAARLLLNPHDRVLLVHADTASLPCASGSVSGWWSVQVFQHFPEEQLRMVLRELDRVLRSRWRGEVYNLNPAILHRLIYWLAGRRLHCSGKQGAFELNRHTAREWEARMSVLGGERTVAFRIAREYSELFFHPNFRILPKRYPLRAEEWIATHAPWLSALFARQVALIMTMDS